MEDDGEKLVSGKAEKKAFVVSCCVQAGCRVSVCCRVDDKLHEMPKDQGRQ